MRDAHFFTCPFCRHALPLNDHSGFAFTRTQIALHLESCHDRPPAAAWPELVAVADELAATFLAPALNA